MKIWITEGLVKSYEVYVGMGGPMDECVAVVETRHQAETIKRALTSALSIQAQYIAGSSKEKKIDEKDTSYPTGAKAV